MGRWSETVNHSEIRELHPLKIDVIKFDGKNNFEMWRCEVMDVLTTSNVEDTL